MAEIIASQQSHVLQIYDVFSMLISLENAESNWSKVFAESSFYLKQTIPQLFPNQLNNLNALLLQGEETIERRNRFEIVQKEIRFAEKHIAQQIDSQVNILEVNELIYYSREQTKAFNFLKKSKELENEAEETIEKIDEQCENMEELCGEIEKLRNKYEDEKTSNNERKNLYQKIRTKYNFLDSIYTDTKDELNEIKIRIDSHLVKLASNTEAQKTALSKSLYMEQAIKDKSTNVASEEESKSAEEIAEMHKKDAQQSVKLIEANDAQVVKFVQIMQEIEKREKKLEEFRKIRDETKVFLESPQKYLQIAKQIYQDKDFKIFKLKIAILNFQMNSLNKEPDDLINATSTFEDQSLINVGETIKPLVPDEHQELLVRKSYFTKLTKQKDHSELENMIFSDDDTLSDNISDKIEATEFNIQSAYDEHENSISLSSTYSNRISINSLNIDNKFQQIQDSINAILNKPDPVSVIHVVNHTTNNNFEKAQFSNLVLNTDTNANIDKINMSIQQQDNNQIQSFVSEIQNALKEIKETTDDINLLFNKKLISESIKIIQKSDSVEPSDSTELTHRANIDEQISDLKNSINDIYQSMKQFEQSINEITNEFIQKITSHINPINLEFEQIKKAMNSIKFNTNSNSFPEIFTFQKIKSHKLSFVTDFEVLYSKTIFQSTNFPMKQVIKLK